MKNLFALLLFAPCVFAQDVRQLFGSGGSVSGSATTVSVKTGIAGQNITGTASGGQFGTGTGFGEIIRGPLIMLDAPDGPEPLPTEFEFAQNYPNPFNPSTTFEFALPRSSEAKLILYDILGRDAAAVFDTVLPAGKYSYHWVAPDNFASGMYFAVFTAGDYHKIRKVMLVK